MYFACEKVMNLDELEGGMLQTELCSPNAYVEDQAPNPNTSAYMVFGDRVFQEEIMIKCPVGKDLIKCYWLPYRKRKRQLDVSIQRKGNVRTQ